MLYPLNSDLSVPTSYRLLQQGTYYGPYYTDTVGGTYTHRYDVRQADGSNTSNYWKLKREGKLIPTNYYVRRDRTADCDSVFTTKYKGNQYAQWIWANNSTGCTLGDWRFADSDLTQFTENEDLRDEQEYLLQKASAKIYSTGWDALTFIGELKDTVRMFNGMTKRYARDVGNILTKIDSLRNPRYRGKFKTISEIHDMLGSKWLEGRYGWRTLGYDLEDIAKMLTRVDDERIRFREGVRGAVVQTTVSKTIPWNWVFCSGYHTAVKEFSYQPGAFIVADIEPPTLQFNPAITGWELATLSFVVDRFVNVGQFLESMSFLALATQWTGAVSYKWSCHSTINTTSVVWKTNYTGTYYQSVDGQFVEKCRHPSNSLPKHPLVKVRLDLPMVADIVELVAQRLKAPRKVIAALLDKRTKAWLP